ncbi:hypothetical protein B0H10DRAFT_2033801 [Mycena sp. CBHHK59/15]|nr:hypothetical protein B0H10DRAFT_2033801 [Mycena sp. CBHHK59/15]
MDTIPTKPKVDDEDWENGSDPELVNYHPIFEQVPFSQWNTTPIPERSVFFTNWKTDNWSEWNGLRQFTPRYSHVSRSIAGLRLKEGFGLPGQILPLAYSYDGLQNYMIFTLVADHSQYFLFIDASELYHLGSFPTLHDFWRRGSMDSDQRNEMIMKDIRAHYQTHLFLRRAIEQAGGELSDIHQAMNNGQKWWDYCARDRMLRSVVEHHRKLIDYEMWMEQDTNLIR